MTPFDGGIFQIADDPEMFRALQDKIFHENAFDCRQYKSNYLKRRIAVRMRALGLQTYQEYMRRLDRDPDEFAKLKDRITINVTEFFRDPEMYRALEAEVMPKLFERKLKEHAQEGLVSKPTLQIWSAGCSTGEEPYSLALLLAEALGSHQDTFQIRIQATDVDQACLARAKEAVYERKALKNLSELWIGTYFRHHLDKLKVADVLRRMVRFEAHDLFSGAAPKNLDMILCRNVIIYFSKEQHLRLFEMFHDALNPGGYLVIGKTESLIGRPRELFKCVSARERIYQRV